MVKRAQWSSWIALLLPALAAFSVPHDWPLWLFMWILSGAVFFALKAVTISTANLSCAKPWRVWAYVFAWVGMNAPRFLSADPLQPIQRPRAMNWLEGVWNTIAGATLFWGTQHFVGTSSQILLGWSGMIGTALMLHFGAFHIMSCAWRSVGIDAPPLMNHPTRSTSVGDFWSRRWNTAFRDVTHQFLFRPLAARLGVTKALLLGFVFSGLIHELVITVPANGGYGGPTAFFCLQGFAILFERSPAGRRIGLGRGWPGWLFSAAVLLLPVRLLFPDAFVLRIAVPFMEALGAA